jgi:4-amino-4-deoxy-L-arabinose transferase-like glycosyltransferase
VNQAISSIRVQYWLYLFIALHVVAWTFAPNWVRFTLPMDSIEGAIWGHQLELGYDKNPFMNGWLTALAVHLGGASGWMIYLFSQLSVALCFWAVWQLGKKMLPPLYALVSVLLLESLQYYNLHAVDFNDNTIELGFWALTVLFFYQALTQQRLRDWIFTGVFAAFGMLTKYYTIVLLLPMFCFLLVNKTARQQLKQSGFHIGLVIFLLLNLPHIVWLFSHDFVTVDYALNRVSNPSPQSGHFFYPLQFSWQQFEVLLPSLPLLGLLCIGKKNPQPVEFSPSTFDKKFIAWMALGPFLLTVLISAIANIKLRAGWGQPLWSLWGILLLVWIQPQITRARLMRFLVVFSTYFILLIVAYCAAFIRAKDPSSANFPGKVIAASLTEEWQKTYHRPLKFIGGSRWLGGNIAFYSKDRPSVYIDWNKKFSPWINETKMKKEGAIFVWDPNEDLQTAPEDVRKRFAKLGELRVLHYTWLRNQKMKPVEITVAFLPPE